MIYLSNTKISSKHKETKIENNTTTSMNNNSNSNNPSKKPNVSNNLITSEPVIKPKFIVSNNNLNQIPLIIPNQHNNIPVSNYNYGSHRMNQNIGLLQNRNPILPSLLSMSNNINYNVNYNINPYNNGYSLIFFM